MLNAVYKPFFGGVKLCKNVSFFALRITGTSSSEIREACFSFIYLNICIHSDQRRDNFSG